MYRKRQFLLCAVLGLTTMASGLAQQPCADGIRVEGTVTDPTSALIPGAWVQTAGGQTTATDAAGRFLLACIPVNSGNIVVAADGF